jgi:hypothetical protein
MDLELYVDFLELGAFDFTVAPGIGATGECAKLCRAARRDLPALRRLPAFFQSCWLCRDCWIATRSAPTLEIRRPHPPFTRILKTSRRHQGGCGHRPSHPQT